MGNVLRQAFEASWMIDIIEHDLLLGVSSHKEAFTFHLQLEVNLLSF